jgi:hypothetical protein
MLSFLPDPDDTSLVAVGRELLKVGSEEKKKQVEGLVVEPSVRDHGLGTLGMVELEERRQKRIHEHPPCNPMNVLELKRFFNR